MQFLFIIRGMPGSGKSTLAKLLRQERVIHSVFEADQYFMVDGEYNFNPAKLKYAHEWCFDQARHALLSCGEDIAVSNTFTQKWEAQRYIDLAKDNGVTSVVITCMNEYGSIHSVPQDALDKMKLRFANDTSDWK